MFKVIFWAHKKEGQAPDEFRQYWLERHAPLAKKLPGLRRYEVSLVEGGPGRTGFPDGVAELYFDSKEAFLAAFSTPRGKEVVDDIPRFTGPSGTVFVGETKIV